MFISKSKFLWGLQCPKLLWHAYTAKHLIPEPDVAQQAIYDQGHEVGALAKQLYPDGVEVGENVTDLDETLRLTTEALKLRRPLFEAAFAANGGYCRVDVLVPVRRDEWDIIEVKSTTSVKEVHLHDLAFQSWVLASAGLRVNGCHLLHINNAYVRHGPVQPKQFFHQANLTEQVNEARWGVDDVVSNMAKVIRLPAAPSDITIGPHCDKPYTCPLHDLCWSFLPKENVFTLCRGGKKSFRLLDEGIQSLSEVPDDYPLSRIQEIQRTAARTGEPHVDRAALKRLLATLEYPLHFLDFETFATAIPLFDGIGPFEQVPFQFSLHIQREPGGRLDHQMFLAQGRNDPRCEFMRELKTVIGSQGSVIVYNAQFEEGILDACAKAVPEFAPWVADIKDRVVDLMEPFKAFAYYHPAQLGSYSIKAVLPALTGCGYEHLAIQEGGTASLEFLRVTFGDVPDEERQRVRRQLEAYCGLDTEGMVWIIEALRGMVS